MLPEDGFNLDFRGFQHVQRRLPAESMTVRFQAGFYMNFRKNSMNFCNSVSFESRSTSQATTSLISQWNLRQLKSYSNKLSYWNKNCLKNLTAVSKLKSYSNKLSYWNMLPNESIRNEEKLKSYSNKLSYWNLIGHTGDVVLSCWNLTVINSATETKRHKVPAVLRWVEILQ